MRDKPARHTIERYGCAAVIMIMVAFACAGPVVARAQSPGIATPNTAGTAVSVSASSYAPVKVDNRKLFDVMAANGLSAADRAARVNRRLSTLIGRDEAIPPFTQQDFVTHGDETTISLAGDTILEVTDADAQDALTSRDELAMVWGQKMVAAVNEQYAVQSNFLTGSGILIRNSFSDLVTGTISWLPRLAGAIIIVAVFAVFARFTRWVFKPVTDKAHFDSNLRHLLRAMVYYGTWVVGLLVALSTLGLNSASLAATIGISGFVLGFAFKDILSHLFAGFMLLLGRQFHVGDQIVVKEFEGTVERIELRALYLRTYDNRLVIIPNGDVFTSAVVSNTDSPFRRREFIIRIGYGDNVKQAQAVALEALSKIDEIAKEPPPDVLVDELSASTVNLKVRFHTHSQRADYLRVGSESMLCVKEAFEHHNISMPSDVQTLNIQNLDQISANRGNGTGSKEVLKGSR